LLLDNEPVSPKQFEEASQNASMVREKLSKFQQRVADKTYSAAMAQKVSVMEQDVAKIETVLENVRTSAEESRKAETEQQLREEAALAFASAVDNLYSTESSQRNACISEEQQERNRCSRLAEEDFVRCRRNRSERLQKEREEMKVQAQIAEELRQRLASENEEMQRKAREEEARKARERERMMKKRRMENFLQHHRRIAVEDALAGSTTTPFEFEFRMVDPPTETVSGTDVPPPAPDAETEQRLIDEALELSLRTGLSDVQDPFNKKPEVQGS
jgi:hypothetical protein